MSVDVKLYLGDCLKILPTLLAGSVDAVVTDPPYGINYDPSFKKWNGSPSDYRKIIGDDEKFDPSPFLQFPTVILFGANYFSDRLPIGGWIVWDKRIKDQLDKMIGNPAELAWCNHTGITMIRVMHGGVVNADSIYGNNEKRFHPTQKPVKVIRRIIEKYTRQGDTILDPFMGSGTTGIACVQTGRNFIGIEIEPKYYGIAEKRIKEAQMQLRLGI